MSDFSAITWHFVDVKISDISLSEYNPRKISKTQKKQLQDSLEKFGVAEPIILNTNYRLIGGHQRLDILRRQGAKIVKASIPNRELTELEEKELNLRLNKNLGEWDFSLLTNNFDMKLLENVGFTQGDLKVDFESDLVQSDEKKLFSVFQVLTECSSEEEQERVFELLSENNYNARIVSL